jgi:hypothetical protein
MTAMSYQMLVFLRAWSGIEASPSELLERRVSAAIAELEEERAMLLEARAILTS